MQFSATTRVLRLALVFILTLTLVPSGPVSAQVAAAATITTANLNCVDFVDSNVGFAAGSAGTILKTVNGGTSWRVVRSGDTLDFRGISFVSATHGWAVSLGGVVVKTTDGGNTWTTVSGDLTGGLYIGKFYDLHFFSETFGRATGGAQDRPPMVFRSYTAGNGTWNVELQAGTYEPPPEMPSEPKLGLGEFYAFDFPTADRAWAVGHDRYKGANKPVIWDYDSSRGGTTWRSQTIPAGTGPLYDVSFATTTTGLAVGSNGKVYRTANGGTSWTLSTIGGTSHEHRGVAFGSGGEAWTVGKSGYVYRTTDSGTTWGPPSMATGVSYLLQDIEWLGGSTAVAVGASGTIIRTTNGTTWSLVTNPNPPVVASFTSASHPASTWVSDTSVDFAWSATGTEIEGYALGFDTAPSTVPATLNESGTTASRTATGSGVWYGHVRARDSVGQWSSAVHREVWVDVDDPAAVFEPEPSGYETRAEVPLTASDAHSGVADLTYSIDGALPVTVAASETTVTIDTPGDYIVEYWASDQAGNVSAPASATVSVVAVVPDAPEVTFFSSASHPSGMWVATTTVDFAWASTGTDIAGYALTLDGSAGALPSTVNETGLSASRTAPGSGVWYGHVRAVDSLAQWSATKHLQVKVDVTPPAVTFSPSPAGYEARADVGLSASDAHSGLSELVYRVDGGPPVVVGAASTTVTIEEPGDHTVTYQATDAAGNVTPGEAIVRVYFVPDNVSVQGVSRYDTALTAANLVFDAPMDTGPDGHRWVVIASGANWPDALAASGLAGALKGPLLLTLPSSIPDSVRSYIIASGADRAAIVGGTGAVSADVQADLAALVGGSANVKRYGEASRYATSARIAQETVGAVGREPWDGVAFLATGGNFPDALAAAPLSAAKGRPMYLAHPLTGVSDETVNAMKAIGVDRVVVLGGTGVVSEASVSKVRAAGITVGAGDRWFGSDRYDTARRIAEESILEGLTPRRAGLATGENYPDALAGGVAQGLSGSVLMLTKSTVLSPPALSFFTDHKGEIEDLRFFGGVKALSDPVRAAALSAATQ